ncbi:hypothetical protein N7470_002117 [Penicillium chermesinum]|nr:hypothetical protein N7470_002117 [Penicillium chermesinum]
MSPPKHLRNESRASRPRSSTRGPLDESDDPLAPNSPIAPTGAKQTGVDAFNGASFHELDPLAPDNLPESQKKDLSYLLRPNIFHPLSQIDIPSPCAPTCLELSGNTVLAAQESKALEDLNSAFYYVAPESDAANTKSPESNTRNIGFGDSRRSIGGLYEIGLEARGEIMKKDTDDATRKIWRDRLEDLGVRSVNALVEMGDLDAAKRSLESLRTSGPESESNKLRRALLLLRIGDTDAAARVFDDSQDSKEAALMQPLLSMSDGRYSDAVSQWRALQEDSSRNDGALVAQNLAVCLLYSGELDEARQLLESQISSNHSFTSLIFNLSTIYELCSDVAGQLKGRLAASIAAQPVSGQTNLDRPNTDFKL